MSTFQTLKSNFTCDLPSICIIILLENGNMQYINESIKHFFAHYYTGVNFL